LGLLVLAAGAVPGEAAGVVTTGVVTVPVLGSRPPRRLPDEVLETEAAGARASVVAGDDRSANSDRAAASAASNAIVTRLRRLSSADRNGLVDGEGFI